MLIRGSIENMMDRCDYDPVPRNGKELIDLSDDDRGDFIAAPFLFFFSFFLWKCQFRNLPPIFHFFNRRRDEVRNTKCSRDNICGVIACIMSCCFTILFSIFGKMLR